MYAYGSAAVKLVWQAGEHGRLNVAELSFTDIHRLLSWLAMEIISVDHVEFLWNKPEYVQDIRLMFYAAPYLFEQSTTRIGFSKSILEKTRPKEPAQSVEIS